MGSVRTHRDYERYAGIDFARRRLHGETRQGADPPCTYVDDKQWEESFTSTFNLPLKWNIADIEPCTDFHFIYFGVEDAAGNVLYRYDAPPDSPEARLLSDQRNAEFIAAAAPARLVVWPFSRSRGWLRKMEYPL